MKKRTNQAAVLGTKRLRRLVSTDAISRMTVTTSNNAMTAVNTYRLARRIGRRDADEQQRGDSHQNAGDHVAFAANPLGVVPRFLRSRGKLGAITAARAKRRALLLAQNAASSVRYGAIISKNRQRIQVANM